MVHSWGEGWRRRGAQRCDIIATITFRQWVLHFGFKQKPHWWENGEQRQSLKSRRNATLMLRFRGQKTWRRHKPHGNRSAARFRNAFRFYVTDLLNILFSGRKKCYISKSLRSCDNLRREALAVRFRRLEQMMEHRGGGGNFNHVTEVTSWQGARLYASVRVPKCTRLGRQRAHCVSGKARRRCHRCQRAPWMSGARPNSWMWKAWMTTCLIRTHTEPFGVRGWHTKPLWCLSSRRKLCVAVVTFRLGSSRVHIVWS